MAKTHTDIMLEGSLLAVGQSSRIVCPHCNGGQSGEQTMNISRTAEGVLYVCHRASCGVRGFGGASASSLPYTPKLSKLQPYEGELYPLEAQDIAYFRDQYEIDVSGDWDERHGKYIFHNGRGEYVLPILDRGYIRGYNVRQPWPNAPRSGRPGVVKTKVWMHTELPVQATYSGPAMIRGQIHAVPGAVVLVEDQLSAIKVAQLEQVAYSVALLGTHLNVERVREIALLRPETVYLALDADATSLAFKHAREFGLAFKKIRVVILEQDLKDTKMADIPKVLGL
jgi:hypothetical protein